MKKVMLVFGTRPEAIKMAPVVKAFQKEKEIETIVAVTAQHREMLDEVLRVFDIHPDYDLNIMKKGQTLESITSTVIEQMSVLLEETKPDIVLVHGDTTTASATAIAAFYKQIPVGHVEAGLRTYDKYSPFPEEFNRQAIDIVADLLFAPTEVSKNNLINAHLNKGQEISVTGNTAIDALQYTIHDDYMDDNLKWAEDGRLILLTAHRRENLGDPMRNIFKAIKHITEEFEDVKVIYPVHMNPKVREVADEVLGKSEKIRLIEPLDVLDFHNYMKKAYFVMSDSGGIQEEAPSLRKPVLVLRNTTERPEGVEAGTLELVGTKESDVYAAAKELLENKEKYEKMANAKNPYGDGKASERIVGSVKEYFN